MSTELKYYKVLKDGQSFHGGNMEWSLPKEEDGVLVPGDWMSVETPPVIQLCSHGLHLTSDPKFWFAHGAKVYEVEIDGQRTDHSEDDAKIAVEKARLVRCLSNKELADLFDIFVVTDDEDVRTDKGLVFAYGNATVRAYGNATVRADGNARVEAYGNARVEAYGNARVEAYGNATVRADGNARVEAYGNATVRAYGNARVEAYGNATVRAYGNATVRADGNARVEAYGNATVNQVRLYHWHENNSQVSLAGNAVCIDRREGKPVISVYQAPPAVAEEKDGQ